MVDHRRIFLGCSCVRLCLAATKPNPATQWQKSLEIGGKDNVSRRFDLKR